MRTFCDEVAWLDHGRLKEVGPAPEVIDKYSDVTHGAKKVKEGQGTRFGSGEAQIRRIELLDRTGRPATSMRTGDEATIRLHYRCEETIEKPVFGCSIDTREGIFAWGLHGLDDGFQPQRIEPGEGTVDISDPRDDAATRRLPHLRLHPALAALQRHRRLSEGHGLRHHPRAAHGVRGSGGPGSPL